MTTGTGTIAVGHGNWEPAGALKAKAAMGGGAASGGGTGGATIGVGVVIANQAGCFACRCLEAKTGGSMGRTQTTYTTHQQHTQ